jgi:hypothetical protein
MSDLLPPAPTPGTDSLVADSSLPKLRRFREDPERAAADGARGRTRHSERARQARVDAYARDLALATKAGTCGPAPVRVALTEELRAMSDSTLTDELDEHLDARARAVADLSAAQQQADAARHEVEEAAAAARAVAHERPEPPSLGTRLTHPAIPWLALVAFAYLEIKLTAPSLRAALASDTGAANQVAAAVAVVPMVAAELIGLAAGSAVHGSRRLARAVLAALAVLTAALTVWAIVSLNASREHNTVYQKSLTPAAEPAPGFGGRGFGAGSSTGGATSATARPAGAAAKGDGPTPDLEFIVPLTLAGVLAVAGLAMRCSVAQPYRRWARRHAAEQGRSDRAAEARHAAEAAAAASAQALDESDLHVGAAAEREQAIATRLEARLRSEYERSCFALGVAPRELAIPELDAGHAQAVAMRIVDPHRAVSTQPVVVPTRIAAPAPTKDPVPDPSLGPDPDPGPVPDPEPGPAPGPEPEPEPAAPPPVGDTDTGARGADPFDFRITEPPESTPGSAPPWPADEDLTPRATDDSRPTGADPFEQEVPRHSGRRFGRPAGWSYLEESDDDTRHNGHALDDVIPDLYNSTDEEPT